MAKVAMRAVVARAMVAVARAVAAAEATQKASYPSRLEQNTIFLSVLAELPVRRDLREPVAEMVALLGSTHLRLLHILPQTHSLPDLLPVFWRAEVKEERQRQLVQEVQEQQRTMDLLPGTEAREPAE